MRVAIMGCGDMGTAHAIAASRNGQEVVACGDPVKSRARKLARAFAAAAWSDCEGMVRKEGVEAVLVASPAHSQSECIPVAVARGLPVFAVAPMARTLESAKRVLASAKEARSKLYVPHETRYLPPIAAIAERLQDGAIGKPGFVRIHHRRPFPRGAGAWYRDFEKSGGAVFDLLLHDFDWLHGLLGPGKRVFCQSLGVSGKKGPDYALVTLTFKSGVIAQLVGSWAGLDAPRFRVEICGDGGMIQYDSAEKPIFVTTAEKHNATHAEGSSPASVAADLQWEEFVTWVKEGKRPSTTARDSIRALKTAEKALISALKRTPVGL